jgi:hypothetical protein
MQNSNISQNEKFQLNKFEEQYLYSVNRNTFVKESSQSIYKRHFTENLFQEESLYIIFGTDSGLLSRYIIDKKTPKNTRYLFIELPQIIEQIKGILPVQYDEESFVFATPDNWKEIATKLEMDIYIYKDNLYFIKSLAAVDCYLVDYSISNQKVNRELEIAIFFTRALVGVFPFMTKQLMNLTENRYPSTLLNGLFKGKTCAILGGGPSLDDDIQWIKKNQKNIVIIAVSRIAKTLIKHELIPHIIVSVDPYELSFDVSKELLLLPKDVLFLQSNCVTPFLLSQWHGRSVYIGKRFPWEEKSDKDVNVVGGPTVTNAALKSAIEMGFSNILLSGVDLCYSKNGVSHAENSNEAKTGPTLSQQGLWVETYAGHKAETPIAFDNAVLKLSQQAAQALEQDINIYNLSENAAKAEHITHLPTAALSFENESDNIWQIINDAIPSKDTGKIRKDNNYVLAKVTKMLKNIQEIKILAQEALKCNDKLFKEKGKESENFKYKIRMDKIEKKLDGYYKKTSNFIKNFGLDRFILSVQTSHETWSDDKIEKTGSKYYQAYLDSCNTLVEHLSATILRINSRIEEEKTSPNFELLFNQWNKDKHYGRAQVWLENVGHKNVPLSPEIQSNLNGFTKPFMEVIDNEKTAHFAKMERAASLNGVKRKIITLFNQSNFDGLQAMINSLNLYDKQNTNFQQAFELCLLAKAYTAKLSNNHESALHFFEQLPEKMITEDELQQIASLAIKLGAYEQAENALKKLSEAAKVFTPQYAKILSLLGKNQQAIDTYNQYLSEEPQDLHTLLCLGKLYYGTNNHESAQLAFQYVLSKEPNNIEAQEYLKSLSKNK